MTKTWTLVLLAVMATVAEAQKPKSLAGKMKGALKAAVDSAATRAAAAVVDSALGTGDTQLADDSGCPPGTVAAQSQTVGKALVKKVLSKDTGAVAPKCVADPTAMMGVVPQQAAQAAAMAAASQAAQAAAMAAAANQVAPNAGSMASAMAAATPIGLAATAAPVAIKGVKALGGLLGKGGPSAAGMIKDLSTKGRLELKGVRFIGASDAFEPGFEDDVAMLAEALGSIEGQFVLNIPAEAAEKAEPDSTMARRRLTKLAAHFAVAGIPESRVRFVSEAPGLDPKKKAPKPGEAKVEVLRAPSEP
ncbi:MAG: hypothetical protein ACKVZ0_10220 [Gemmatimonadales bacterium]